MSEAVVRGLDGGVPLGFLAGLGLLRALEAQARDRSGADAQVTLSWRLENRWCPVLGGAGDLDDVTAAVAADAERGADDPVLAFRTAKLEKRGVKEVSNLRAPQAVLRAWLRERLEQRDADSLCQVSGLMCESACEPIEDDKAVDQSTFEELGIPIDPAGSLRHLTQPTFFDFTSRNAQFLEQVEYVRGQLSLELIRDELVDGRSTAKVRRGLDWDLGADTPGAIYTSFVRGRWPASEWLAFRGLAFFPVFGAGARCQTTACTGRRKTGTFHWVLWHGALDEDTVRSLVASSRLTTWTPDERRRLRIAARFRAALTKQADRYAGMFGTPQPF